MTTLLSDEAATTAQPAPRPLDGVGAVLCGQFPELIAPVARLLRQLGSLVRLAESTESLEKLLKAGGVDLIFAHICPSRPQLMALLSRTELPPIIVLLPDKELYFESINRGAFDCLPLCPEVSELVRVTRLAIGQGQKGQGMAAQA